MHFDQRTQRALSDAGLTRAELQAVSESITEAAAAEADAIEAFFKDLDTVYSDMEMAHSTAEFPEHDLSYVDLYTHAEELRGYIKFGGWGAYVEDGRVLSDDVVELTLGPTVHDRVRFAAAREEL
ncbi:MAG: hypothetical protein PPP58_02905 [Natronomonas sp.]